MHQAFLDTILEHPSEDSPRLVYCDWLEEQGDIDRAEFIRLGCRYPHSVPMGLPTFTVMNVRHLRGLSTKTMRLQDLDTLLGDLHNCSMTVSEIKPSTIANIIEVESFSFHPVNYYSHCYIPWTGNEHELTFKPASTSATKPATWHDADRFHELLSPGNFWQWFHNITIGQRFTGSPSVQINHSTQECTICDSTGPQWKLTIRRGFVQEIAMPLGDWITFGPRIVRLQPVQYVQITDRKPRYVIDFHDNPIHSWHRHPEASESNPMAVLPEQFFGYWDAYRHYEDTEKAAYQWLSDQCLRIARESHMIGGPCTVTTGTSHYVVGGSVTP